jgi:hypothetical protein
VKAIGLCEYYWGGEMPPCNSEKLMKYKQEIRDALTNGIYDIEMAIERLEINQIGNEEASYINRLKQTIKQLREVKKYTE